MLSGVKVLVQVICTKCPEYWSVVAKVEYCIIILYFFGMKPFPGKLLMQCLIWIVAGRFNGMGPPLGHSKLNVFVRVMDHLMLSKIKFSHTTGSHAN